MQCIPSLAPYHVQRFLRNEDFRIPDVVTRLEERGSVLFPKSGA